MAKSEARRQKQLAKKKAKRDDRRSFLARANSDDPNVRLANAENWPIIICTLSDTLWTDGIGACNIGRRMPGDRVAIASFLVDRKCLGVKNVFWKIGTESDLEEVLSKTKRTGGYEIASPERFAKFIYDAVEYAQRFGFQPHPDYSHARQLLKGIDPTACNDVFEFGQDGKPFFINGPYDSPAKIKLIMHRLRQVGGNFALQTGPEMSVFDSQNMDEYFEVESE